MKSVLTVLGIFMPFFIYSQTYFQKGYFISNDGQRKEVLIKNLDWNNNPTSFDYKMAQDAAVTTATLANTAEFGVDGVSKYVKATVGMDMVSQRHGSLPKQRIPTLTERTVFLKVISEGKETLYVFDESGINLFFFKNDEGKIEQLIYRKYFIKDGELLENLAYKAQLNAQVKCDADDARKIEKLEYTLSKLTAYFDAVNACGGKDLPESEKKAVTKLERKKGFFRLSPSVAYNSYKAEADLSVDYRDFSFSKSGVSFGAELEFVLPTNNNKLSVFIDPSYHNLGSYQDTRPINTIVDETVKVKLSYLQIPIGMRYYFFLSPESKVFVNAAFNYNLTVSSVVEYEEAANLGINGNLYNFGFGAGYNYKRISAEVRVNTGSKFINNLSTESNLQNPFSLIVRYNILKGK